LVTGEDTLGTLMIGEDTLGMLMTGGKIF